MACFKYELASEDTEECSQESSEGKVKSYISTMRYKAYEHIVTIYAYSKRVYLKKCIRTI